MPRPSLLRRRRSRGQSVVELALVVPVMLLLTLTAIDFGRVFLGWVNLQQMTRITANHAAEHASAWAPPGDPSEKAKYQQKVKNDARLINCALPDPIPDPILSGGVQLGAPVTVGLSCQFQIITPIISNIIGGTILVSAETTYPVKEGVVATVPGGGAPILPPPTADFQGSPRTGWGPDLEVTFINESKGAPTSQTWLFNVMPGGSGTGGVDPPNSTSPGTQTVTYSCIGPSGATCTFGVSLSVSNPGGSDTHTEADYITVTVPPDTGPIAEFSADPRSGVEPQTVRFDFVDLRAGTVTYTSYRWDFNEDGSPDATGRSPSWNYPTDGTYDVTLTVTDSAGVSSTLTKLDYIVITNKSCTVPDFGNTRRNQAQSRWRNAEFTTQVLFQAGQGNYTINYQSITGGTIDPQPDGCDSVITVGP